MPSYTLGVASFAFQLVHPWYGWYEDWQEYAYQHSANVVGLNPNVSRIRTQLMTRCWYDTVWWWWEVIVILCMRHTTEVQLLPVRFNNILSIATWNDRSSHAGVDVMKRYVRM